MREDSLESAKTAVFIVFTFGNGPNATPVLPPHIVS